MLMRIKFFVFSMFFSLICYCQTANANCWNEAGLRYNIDPVLLMAIGWQESRGKPNAVGVPLKDGNIALGLMQINTIHLPELKKYGIEREDLFDACTSVMVGAYVLRDCLNSFNQDLWRSVGCYYGGKHSRAYTAMNRYAHSVKNHYENYQIMFSRGRGDYNNSNKPQIQTQTTGRSRLELILFDN